MRVDPGGVPQGRGGMGPCPGCVTSYEALGGARLPHSPPATLVPLSDHPVGQRPLSLVLQGWVVLEALGPSEEHKKTLCGHFLPSQRTRHLPAALGQVQVPLDVQEHFLEEAEPLLLKLLALLKDLLHALDVLGGALVQLVQYLLVLLLSLQRCSSVPGLSLEHLRGPFWVLRGSGLWATMLGSPD